MKSKKKIKCPYCNSTNVAKILYGLPVFSKNLAKELENGKTFLGGCVISEDSPRYRCNDCLKTWK